MKPENLNDFLRSMFKKYVGEGHKKRHICGLVLGAQNEPQFEGFLSGRDFGLKPLQRIIDGLGFKLEIIITPREESELTKYIEEVNTAALTMCDEKLGEKLSDENAIRSSSTVKTGVLAEVSEELFDHVMKS